MPKAIAIVGIVVGGLITGGTLWAGGFVMFGTMLSVTQGVMLGASIAASSTMGLIKQATASSLTSMMANRSVTVREATASRKILYGFNKGWGGTEVYTAKTAKRGDRFSVVIVLSAKKCHAITQVYADNKPVYFDITGHATGDFAGYMDWEFKLGDPSDAPFLRLIDDTSLLPFDQKWTLDHRLDGLCAVAITTWLNATKFPNGMPKFTFDIQGAEVYDPRSSTTGYTANLALCIRDYMLDVKLGMKIKLARINDAIFSAAANLADEDVPLLAGGTEKRYECNGVVDTSHTHGDILKGMLSAGFGRISQIAGQWCLFLGAWRAPELELSTSDFRAPLTLTGLVSRKDLYNAAKAIYVDPATAATKDAPALIRASYVARDNGVASPIERGKWITPTHYVVDSCVVSLGTAYVCTVAHDSDASNRPGSGVDWADCWSVAGAISYLDLQFPFTTSVTCVQRLMKMELESRRRQITIVAPCHLGAYQAQPITVVLVQYSRLNFVDKTFEVQPISFPFDGTTLGADLTMQETDSEVYAWSSSEEEDASVTPAAPSGDPLNVQPVTSLTAVSGPATVIARADGVHISRIRVTWDSPADDLVVYGGRIFVYYKKSADPDWIALPALDGAAQELSISTVDDGVSYDVQVIAANVLGARSAAAQLFGHVVSASSSHITQGALTPISIGNRNSAIVGGANPLSAIDNGTSGEIDVAAFLIQFGFGQVGYNSGSITGLAYNTGYWVYCLDTSPPTGGAVVYHATNDFTAVVADPRNIYVGAINTPAAGSGPTGGLGGGGGCCCVDQYLDTGKLVEHARKGEVSRCHLGEGRIESHPIEEAWPWMLAHCVELEYENGARWRGSRDTPFRPVNGSPCYVPQAAGLLGLTERRVEGEWRQEVSKISRVRPIGIRAVRMMYFGQREFAAGSDPDLMAYTHNSLISPVSDGK